MEFEVHDFILAVVIAAMSGGLAVYVWAMTRKPVADLRLQGQVDALVRTLGEVQAGREADRRELQETKNLLAKANLRIAELEQRLNVRSDEDDGDALIPELLAIFGPDPVIAERDKRGLREAGVDYESIAKATRDAVVDEVAARREDRRPLRLVHIGSHGVDGGVVLVRSDGSEDVVPAQWWRETVDTAHVVLLSVCKGTSVSNELAAMTDYLVYFRENVKNEDAAQFAGIFWSSILSGINPRTAYFNARRAVPGVRDFVGMRYRRGKGSTEG